MIKFNRTKETVISSNYIWKSTNYFILGI